MEEQGLGEQILQVCAEVRRLARPEKVILFNRKLTLSGKTASFKLVVVADTADKRRLEKELYLAIDSPVPFDVVLYTPGEWAQLAGERGSFAAKVRRIGKVLYEA
ncbi:hypothetical protein [Bittarella massiliensis (ex Durand et al. 2017)]|uniref:hypothetical protein n=1 Tax=Bittarella massiliensis (ex Durand et al. 2017) TaxID=1720313 RepID=UPI00073E70D0|nr:hypothetical protein [Bittarella massiliensis (ex Durand et al. 2017)]